MLKRKQPKFIPGEILEVPLRSGRYGYCQVQLKEAWGALINIFEPVYDEPQDPTEWKEELPIKKKAYVNPSSARHNKWKHVCVLPLGPKASELPNRFYGGTIAWTIVTPDGNKTMYERRVFTWDELVEKGYIDTVIWLADSIEKYIDEDVEMVWKGYK
jgi:hypothetical protein